MARHPARPADRANYGHLTVQARNSKNSKFRNLPLTARVLEMLKRRAGLKLDGLVFLGTSDGGKHCQTWMNEQYRTIRDLLKLPIEFVPHSLAIHSENSARRIRSRRIHYNEAHGP